MRSTAVFPVLVALLILVAGCTSVPSGDRAMTTTTNTEASTTTQTTSPAQSTTQPTTTQQPTTTLTPTEEVLPDDSEHVQQTLPAPPETLTVASAVRAARQYEEAYLYRYFSNRSDVRRFGLTPTTAGEDAHVVNRTDAGYYVRVQHPFSYATESAHGDGASHALYLVNTTAIRRVSADYPD